jgi:putative ABC transport system permease protein
LKSFTQLLHVDAGIVTGNTVSMRLSLPDEQYKKEDRARFWQRLSDELKKRPAIASAGFNSFLPLGENDTQTGYWLEGQPKPKGSDFRYADLFVVGGDYFKTMGVQLVKGRTFAESDREKAPPVVVIDEEFARKNYPSTDPLGKKVMGMAERGAQIVGVVKHVKAYGPDGDTREQFYFPLAQTPGFAGLSIVVRPSDTGTAAVEAVRAVVRSMDAGLPVYSVRPMQDLLNDSTWRARLSTILLCTFSALALILAAVGVYGVMAYSVAQRTQEIGVRMALGATPGRVLKLVLRQAAVLSLVGVAAGLLAAVPLTGLMRAVLFQTSPSDATVFSIAPVILTVSALVAGVIPARRAAQTDPLEAIRYE